MSFSLDYAPDGEITLIRFIRSDQKIDMFGEEFEVSKDLVYSYVKAVIPTDLYGQFAYLESILDICAAYGIPVIVDSAEALGSKFRNSGILNSVDGSMQGWGRERRSFPLMEIK